LNTVHVRWLKIAWALAAFLPLAAILTPILAPRIGVVFLVCAMYLWPAGWLSHQLGIEPLTPLYTLVSAVYCAMIGALAATLATRALRLPAHISRGRALTLTAIIWLPMTLFASYQVLQYGGVFTRESACPGHLYILQPHCAGVTELIEQELEGFIDTTYVASFRVAPTALQTIVTTNAMHAVDVQKVPDVMWRQPPIWWRPSRSPDTQVYATPSFAFGRRSGDGDHYMLIDDRRTGKVYVYLESNF
jgi:hypothetical protein